MTHPTLDRLIIERKIWWEEGEQNWVGRASDGVKVLLGNDRDSVERYLSTCPTPEDW
jgi:hypothetical protein